MHIVIPVTTVVVDDVHVYTCTQIVTNVLRVVYIWKPAYVIVLKPLAGVLSMSHNGSVFLETCTTLSPIII